MGNNNLIEKTALFEQHVKLNRYGKKNINNNI